MKGHTDRWIEKQMDRRAEQRTDIQAVGATDRRTDSQTDRQMDGQPFLRSCFVTTIRGCQYMPIYRIKRKSKKFPVVTGVFSLLADALLRGSAVRGFVNMNDVKRGRGRCILASR